MIGFRQNVRNVLWRMSWRVPRRHYDVAKSETIAVLDLFVLKSVVGTAFMTPENFFGFTPRAYCAGATHEIGVNMRFKNVRDREPRFPRHVDVNVAIWP